MPNTAVLAQDTQRVEDDPHTIRRILRDAGLDLSNTEIEVDAMEAALIGYRRELLVVVETRAGSTPERWHDIMAICRIVALVNIHGLAYLLDTIHAE